MTVSIRYVHACVQQSFCKFVLFKFRPCETPWRFKQQQLALALSEVRLS